LSVFKHMKLILIKHDIMYLGRIHDYFEASLRHVRGARVIQIRSTMCHWIWLLLYTSIHELAKWNTQKSPCYNDNWTLSNLFKVKPKHCVSTYQYSSSMTSHSTIMILITWRRTNRITATEIKMHDMMNQNWNLWDAWKWGSLVHP